MPVVALPGQPSHALAAYLFLVQPLLDHMSARLPRKALVQREANTWQVLAVGDFSLDNIRMADAWLAIGGDSEGYAAGAFVEAFPLRAT